jgi:OFA family oxalate/formate antiporter-like MFS transporter
MPRNRFPRRTVLKRYGVLVICVTMLVFLGTNQAWSVFVKPLRAMYDYSAFQMQLIFNTGTFTFCTLIILSGRLHDRFGPRPLAAASAGLIGLAWTLAWALGDSFFWLWLSMGVLASAATAVGYVCPIATAIKWFPARRGLVSGLTAAGFGGGPILLSAIAEALLRREWQPMGIFGLIAATYAPAVLLTGMMLALPPGQPAHADVLQFRRRDLARDRRFWALAAGMFTGTLPFLLVMGNAKPLALDMGLPETLAVIAITVLAAANALGRIGWGAAIDRIGPRRSILSAQALVLVSLVILIALGGMTPAAFFAGVFGVGLCYGSCFAVYPATVTRLYGAHVLGSVYPFIMAAQAVSSFASSVNGLLKDATGSSYPGLAFALAAALAGTIACVVLTRSLSEERLTEQTP